MRSASAVRTTSPPWLQLSPARPASERKSRLSSRSPALLGAMAPHSRHLALAAFEEDATPLGAIQRREPRSLHPLGLDFAPMSLAASIGAVKRAPGSASKEFQVLDLKELVPDHGPTGAA